MTIPASPPSPPSPPSPHTTPTSGRRRLSSKTNSLRTPTPTSHSSPRSPSRRKHTGSASETPPPPPADQDSSPRQRMSAAAAPTTGSPGYNNNRLQNSPPLYHRKNPPPPPPPRSPRTPSHSNSNSDQQQFAAQELHRAYSAGSISSGNMENNRRSSRSRSPSASFSSRRERRNSNNSQRDVSIEVYPTEGGGGDYHNYSTGNNNNSTRDLDRFKDLLVTESDSSNTNNYSNDRNSTGEEQGQGRRSPDRSNIQLRNEEEEEGAARQDDDYEEEEEEPPPKGIFARLFRAVLCIFPKLEPLPWGTFAILTVWSCIPPFCFILFFTQMGFGEHIYYTIALEMGEYGYALGLGLAVFMFTLYMLDADEWTSHCGSIFLDFFILTIVFGLVLLVLLIADRFPYGMVCLFAVFHPLWLLAFKLMWHGEKDTRTFVSWLSGPLFFISIVIVVAWTAWVFSDPDNEWNIVARVVAAERTGCEPNYENYEHCRKEPGLEETCFYVEKSDGKEFLKFPDGCDQTCTKIYNDCLNGFILWIGPVLISMTTFFLSFFCTFLRTEGAREKDVLNFGVVWVFLIFAMWVTTSLAGTAAGVTAALAALTLASFVASAMFVAVSFSKAERNQNAAAVFERLRQKYGKHLDVVRALFVVTCAPFVLLYFGFSMMNQFIRRIGIFPCSQPSGEEGDSFTARTRTQVNVMKSWDRAKVYTFAVYWGIAFMIMQVIVANLTVVFLSWIIEKTEGFGLAPITAIMCAVGVMMFLLPPVPGVPVYLTLGIVLPAEGHKTLGWTGSILYCSGVGLVLKLFSSALQQKGIGQNLSHYVKVRQFVGINSILMKAMRLVLDKEGLSVPKVSILIGGPDWPTSVLCGIMRLSLPQIMLGTTPIIFLIFPTCLSGALLYMASVKDETGNPEFAWAGTISAITLSITAIVQFGSMIVAAYYLEQTAAKRSADVDAILDDREVKEADDKAAHLNRCYRDVTQWDMVPFTAKLLLQTSLGCIITSCYMVQFFTSLCFTPHSLTDSIDDNLDGKVANLFLPLGWVAGGLFCISTMLLYLFQSWGQQKAHKLASGVVVSASPDESPIDAASTSDASGPRYS